ncbi:MAG: type II CRISPR RNA-guided endonuclease Cas9 [Planctomycetes bacterium]|nr:type II CRISPR RNA-guided endonuclease Cas9 [Planctomycetota bacterium]
MNEKAPYILGLDLGPNSIGWALVRTKICDGEFETQGLLDTSHAGHPPLGVRVFEAGLQNFDTSKEASLNQARRAARSARRTISRRRARKGAVRKALQAGGLLPTNQDELQSVLAWNPYELRAAALNRQLEPYELGRAVVHMAQRRGFQSNRLTANPKEEKGLLAEISKLQDSIDAASARTLGEYLYMQTQATNGVLPVRLRARMAKMDLYEDAPRRTRRSMYEQEFDTIIKKQLHFWDSKLPSSHNRDAMERALSRAREAIFFQHGFAVTPERKAKAPSRANLHRAPGVHPCPYEPGEVGCPRSEWIAQRFRIVKDVQNLRISEAYEPERPLSDAERRLVVDKLSLSKKVTFSSLTKALTKQLELREPIEFNLERGGRSYLLGNETEATLGKAFGKSVWAKKPEADRGTIRTAFLSVTDSDALRKTLIDAGLSDPTRIDELLDFQPKDDGYLSFSKVAITKLLPLMEDEGLTEHEAIERLYPETHASDGLKVLPSLIAMQSDLEIRPKIPPRIQNQLTNLTNPIIRRSLTEVRKVVNAILRAHGKPEEIVIELAREMKQNKEARDQYSRDNHKRSLLRDQAREALRPLLGGTNPRKADVDRWMLWQEQRMQCPYCGKSIGQTAVCSAETEVDHILPRWQSLDDSLNNKVLCCANCNAAKGDRHPVAWLGKDSERFSTVLKRVRLCAKTASNPGGMSNAKIGRFEIEELDADDFVDSQLNDTRYISRLVSSYVSLLYPSEERVGQRRVRTSRGSLTAMLRRQWGLNDILPPLVQAHGEVIPGFEDHEGWTEKLRIDHRHHAVDALVIALSTRGHLKRLQDNWRRGQALNGQGNAFPEPWPSLRVDAQQALEQVNVSHRPMRRLRGALHEETYYGKLPRHDGTYVTRKRLSDLSPKMIGQIRDLGIRRIVEDRLKSMGWAEGKELPKNWHEKELVVPAGYRRRMRGGSTSPTPIRRVRITTNLGGAIALGDREHRFAKPGGNHCFQIAFPEECDGPKVRVLSRFRASQSFTNTQEQDSCSVQLTLHRKDSVLVLVPGLKTPVLAIVQKFSGPDSFDTQNLDLTLRHACDARKATIGNGSPLLRIKSIGKLFGTEMQLATVDPIGRVQPGPKLSQQAKND